MIDVESVRSLGRAVVHEIAAHLPAARAVPDPARCVRGKRCAAAERSDPDDPKSPLIGAALPRDADRLLCPACERAVPSALEDAPALYVDLRNAAMLRGSTPNSPRGSASAGSPLGINGGPYALAEQLHWWITAWADQVIWTARRPAPDRAGQTAGQQVDDACWLLRRYLSAWLAHRPVEFQTHRSNGDPDDPKAEPTKDTPVVELAGWQGCAWLLDWRDDAERAIKKPRLVHYPPEPCPACNVPGVLRRRDGDDKVSCSNCGKEWTLKMYETFVHAWIGAH